ncbi:MAG TPA: M20/M25/M40 family metallo-hydrolase [Baekduia sp.]|nr:M20/M25/M40 family metallo-hydrolase [Baekduia sp.]
MSRFASELERRRLNELFAELCAISSPSRNERAVADRVAAELRALGLEVAEDQAGEAIGANAGNLLVRIPGRSERTIMLAAHLDTVDDDGISIEPILEEGVWTNANDTILGADNKAAVAVLLAVAHRVAIEGSPVGLELLFTVCEEDGLQGAAAFDVTQLHSEFGFVFDHASPIGEVIVASPTYFFLEAEFRGKAAHAGIRPEAGSNAIVAAAKAIESLQWGRIDPETTANVGGIEGGGPSTNVVADRCVLRAETRSLAPARAETQLTEMIDRCQDAANRPECSCDLDVTTHKHFDAYRHAANATQVLVAEAALRECGIEPLRVQTGGGSDANAFEAAGFPCTNLANGTERNHEPTESVSAAALEQMLDVTFALLRVAAET